MRGGTKPAWGFQVEDRVILTQARREEFLGARGTVKTINVSVSQKELGVLLDDGRTYYADPSRVSKVELGVGA